MRKSRYKNIKVLGQLRQPIHISHIASDCLGIAEDFAKPVVVFLSKLIEFFFIREMQIVIADYEESANKKENHYDYKGFHFKEKLLNLLPNFGLLHFQLFCQDFQRLR